MVRRRAIRHALAATLAAVLIPSLAFGQLAYAPFILTTGVDEADTFVTLAESTTFGPGGSIFDYSTRISTPEVLTKPDTTAFANGTNSDFRNDVCSSDNTTWTDLRAAAILSGGDRLIYLPDDCRVIYQIAMATGSTAQQSIADTVDNVDFACHADATDCGITIEPAATSGSPPEWDWNDGNVSRQSAGNFFLAVGSARTTQIDSCNWTGGYDVGTKKIETDCVLTTGTSDEMWGPGDIVRLSASADPDTNSNWTWTTRVTCVDGNTAGTSDQIGTDCTEIDGDNQIQIRDALPQSYGADAYWWGQVAGGNVDTSGHLIEQLERVGSARGGIGTETTNVAENIWFSNINWRMTNDLMFNSSGGYVRFEDAQDSGIVDSTFHDCPGKCFSFGEGVLDQAAGILIQGNDFLDDVWDNNCFAEVEQIDATNPVRIHFYNASCAMTSSADPYVEFSDDVAEPALAGKSFVKNLATDNGDGTSYVSLTGVDGTGFNTTPGGIIASHDSYAMALTYCNGANNVQFINNAMIGTRMGPLRQTACAGHVMFANFIKNGTDVHASRGEFIHGNGGAPGSHSEMNDYDLGFVMLASGNTARGEGTNNVWFKNRGRSHGAMTWPDGTHTANPQCDYGDLFCRTEFPNQGGASNEDWSVFGNSFVNYQSVIDDADNSGTSTSSSVAPHQLKDLAWYRNRCNGCDLDSAFDSQNTTTSKDTNPGDEDDESASVPAAWSAEVGAEPTSIFMDSVPSWWCQEAMTFGEMGAYYDDYGGTFTKLPAQIRYEGTTCTPP